MSELLKAQWDFLCAVSCLIERIFDEGYAATVGDAYRDPRCPYGSRNSRHRDRLAIDLNIFTPDGKYIERTEDYPDWIGQYWEQLGGIWGGRFRNLDGNHFEWHKPAIVAAQSKHGKGM